MYSGEAALARPSEGEELDWEEAVVERLKAGDAAAFDELFNCYRQMVYRLAWRLLGEREEAMDLTQEVFLLIYSKVKNFRAESSLKTWIYRIVVNCALNRQRFWRRHGGNNTLSLEESNLGCEQRRIAAALRSTDPSPFDLLCSREIEQRVHSALRQLPMERRLAVIMRDIEGLSYEEIAAATGASLGTVKSRIARGREELRRKLKDLLGAKQL